MVSLGQTVDAQWGQVQNVYQRRADLVPNLSATVKGAANFEKSTRKRYDTVTGAFKTGTPTAFHEHFAQGQT